MGELVHGQYTSATIPTATANTDLPIQVDSQGRLLAAVQGVSGGTPVSVSGGPDYETVAASQSAQILGATGAVGDRLDGLLIVPATLSPGAVSVTDGNGSAIPVFTGGTNSVSNLVPFFVPISAKCVAASTPGWKVTTGTNVSVFATGDFT